MKFSVLMSLYAKERPTFLRQSLNSVFGQTLRADEVVLVEDGPITTELDNVVKEYCAKYPELKVVPLPVNGGLGNALNEGLKHCSYDLIARMDTDDVAKPDRFRRQIDFMEAHPEISVCSAGLDEFIDSIENIVSEKTLPEFHDEIFQYGKNRCPINHPAVIYKRQPVIEVGGYGPFPEDYYLWGRLLMAGYKFHNIQDNLLWFRTSPDVYKRRGGWKYCKAMNRLQWNLYSIEYLSFFEYLKNISIRSIVSLMPNALRSKFYEKALRSKAK